MSGLYALTPGPAGQAMTNDDFVKAASSQPFSYLGQVGQDVASGFLNSTPGTAIQGLLTDAAGRQAVPTYGRGIVQMEGDAAIRARGDEPLTEPEYKASEFYRQSVPWDARMTQDRAQALASWDDARTYREQVSARGNRPVTSFLAHLAGGGVDPINFVPILGEEVRAAQIARFGGLAGKVTTSAADAALNGAIAGVATAPTRVSLGEDVSWQSILSQAAMGAVVGGVFGAGVHGLDTWRTSRATNSLANVMKASAALDDAVSGVVRGGDVSLSPASIDGISQVAVDMAPHLEAAPANLSAVHGQGDAVAPPKVETAAELKARFTGPDGAINLGSASDALSQEVQAALGVGRKVTIYVEGKAVPIVSVDRGMMADAKGQRWGMLPLISKTDMGEPAVRIDGPAIAEQMNAEGALPPPASSTGARQETGTPAKSTAPVTKPTSLIDFLSRVGIKDDGGELAHMGMRDLFIPGRGRLVRKNGGVPLDQAREMAVQAGYLHDAGWDNPDVQSTSTVADFLDALSRDHDALRAGDQAKRVYSWNDRSQAAAFLGAAHQARANDQIAAFAEMAKEDGHAITDEVLMERAAAHYYEHGGSVDGAIDRASIELAAESPDVRAVLTETIPGWEDALHSEPVRGSGDQAPGQGLGGAGHAAEGDAAGARGAVRDAGGSGREADLPVEHDYALTDGAPKEHAGAATEGPTVFHGTLSDFRKFDLSHLGKESDATRSRLGFFFTDSPDVARTYASADRYAALRKFLPEGVVDGLAKVSDGVLKLFGAKPGRQEGRVITAKIDAGKQFVYELPAGAKAFDPAEVGAVIAHAKEKGFDSVLIKNMVDDGYGGTTGQASNVHIVFDPDHIHILDHGTPGPKAPEPSGLQSLGRASDSQLLDAYTGKGAPRQLDTSPPNAAPSDPAIKDAAARVARPEDLRQVATQHGVNPETGAFAEERDIQQLMDEGRLTPEDQAELDAANQAFEHGSAWGDALRAAMTCVMGAV